MSYQINSKQEDEEDDLSQYYADEDLSQYYEEQPIDENLKQGQDPITEELKAHGYEDQFDVGDEMERNAERGTAEATRGLISGATFGISENVPGLKTGNNIAAEGGKFVGSILPIEGLMMIFNNPLVKLAQKSPVYQKSLSALASIIGSVPTGAAYKAGTDIAKGEMPSVDDVLEHGAEWGFIDAALQGTFGLGRFVASMTKSAQKSGKPVWKEINDFITKSKAEGVDFSKADRVNAKVMSLFEEPAQVAKSSKLNLDKSTAKTKVDQPLTAAEAQAKKMKEKTSTLFKQEESKAAKSRETIKQVKDETFRGLEKDAPELAEPIAPKELDILEVAEESSNVALDEQINAIAQRATTKAELGANIKGDLDSGLQAARDSYKPAYDLIEEHAQFINHVPQNTRRVGDQILQSLEVIKTKPTGYATVMKSVETALEDAGYQIQRDSEGKIREIISAKDVNLRQTLELGRRLNEIINYDVVEKSIQDRLKPLARAVKQDIRVALSGDKGALEMFENAEREFGEAAQKYGTESLRKIRSEKLPEKVLAVIKSPTALAEVKNAVTEGQFNQIQRELLENMKEMSEQKAQAFYREVRPTFTDEARAAAEEIIESKMAREAPGRRERLHNKLQETILDDLSKGLTTGQRPATALNLWKTKEGQKLIKEALKDVKNKEEVLKYLADQSFHDFTSTFIGKDGQVNFKKFNELLKDPMIVENIRTLGGDEAVTFFKNLENISNRIKNNINHLESLPFKKKGEQLKKTADSFKPKSEYGDYLLRKTAEKNKQAQKTIEESEKAFYRPSKTQEIGTAKVGKKTAKDRLPQESVLQRGDKRIQKMNRKDHPFLYKVQDFADTFGLKTKALLSVLGFTQLGIPQTAALAVVLPAIKKVATSRSVRKALTEAASSRTNPALLFSALENLNESLGE